MITKAPFLPPLPAATAAREESFNSAPAEELSQGFSLTSHSFTLNTKLFNLDVSWKRLEVEGRDQPKSVSSPLCETKALSKPHAKQANAPTFSEILKRQQLASLLVDTNSPPYDSCETIQSGTNGPNLASAGSAQRAYKNASPEGPLGGDRVYKA